MAQTCQSNGVNERGVNETQSGTVIGNKLPDTNPVYTRPVTSTSFWLDRYDTITGTVSAVAYNSAGVKQHTWASKDITSLATSNQEEAFTGSPYTVAADDVIGLEFTSLGGDGGVQILDDDSGYTNWIYSRYNGTSWSTDTGRAWKQCLTYTPTSTGGTFLPPPPAMVRL